MSDFWSDSLSTSILYVCDSEGSGETAHRAGLLEPSLVAYVISTIISRAGSIVVNCKMQVIAQKNGSV